MQVIFADADTVRSAAFRERERSKRTASTADSDGGAIAAAQRVPTADEAARDR